MAIAARAINEPHPPRNRRMQVQAEELAKLKAHKWQISCLDFKPDGTRLATAGWDKEVHIWDLINLEVTTTLKGVHRVPIINLSWQKPHGRLLCTGSADRTAVLWNPENGKQVATLSNHTGWVTSTCFSTSGSLLATASWDKTLSIWDPNLGAHINTFTDHTEGVWSVDFHPTSSKVLCSASEDGTVRIWDLREGKASQTLDSGHSDAVYCAKWSPDGRMIASGSADTKICIWEPNTGSLINSIYGHTDTVKSLTFNPNTNAALPILASAGDYTILLSDPRPTQKAEIISISPHNLGKEVETVSISPDGSVLVSGGRDGLLVLITLTVPSLRPQIHNDSFSARLRNSQVILDKSYRSDSVDDLIEATSQISASEGDLSSALDGSGGSISLESLQDSKTKQVSSFEGNKEHSGVRRKDISARESRQKRTEKKVVDLPTMIAHLSSSLRDSTMEDQMSSSESEDEITEEEEQKLNSLIDITQKVNKYSQISKKTSVEEVRHMTPNPRLSLLPEDAPEMIKERRKLFEGERRRKDDSVGSNEDQYEQDDSDSESLLQYYSLQSPDFLNSSLPTKDFQSRHQQLDSSQIPSREQSFSEELGSGDEYYDNELSMI